MITRQSCYEALFRLKDSGVDITSYLELLKESQGVPREVVKFLQEESPQFKFYKDLQKNQRALVKNILNYESLDNIARVKVCSSLITRAMISVEYKNISPVLLEELELDKISNAITKALGNRDYAKLDEVLRGQRETLKLFVKELPKDDN